MLTPIVYQCGCERCQSQVEHLEKLLHQQINWLMSQLDERQRRLYAALEAERYGYGGDTHLSRITGLDRKTIRRGRQELAQALPNVPVVGVRHVGGGRPALEKKARHRASITGTHSG